MTRKLAPFAVGAISTGCPSTRQPSRSIRLRIGSGTSSSVSARLAVGGIQISQRALSTAAPALAKLLEYFAVENNGTNFGGVGGLKWRTNCSNDFAGTQTSPVFNGT